MDKGRVYKPNAREQIIGSLSLELQTDFSKWNQQDLLFEVERLSEVLMSLDNWMKVETDPQRQEQRAKVVWQMKEDYRYFREVAIAEFRHLSATFEQVRDSEIFQTRAKRFFYFLQREGMIKGLNRRLDEMTIDFAQEREIEPHAFPLLPQTSYDPIVYTHEHTIMATAILEFDLEALVMEKRIAGEYYQKDLEAVMRMLHGTANGREGEISVVQRPEFTLLWLKNRDAKGWESLQKLLRSSMGKEILLRLLGKPDDWDGFGGEGVQKKKEEEMFLRMANPIYIALYRSILGLQDASSVEYLEGEKQAIRELYGELPEEFNTELEPQVLAFDVDSMLERMGVEAQVEKQKAERLKKILGFVSYFPKDAFEGGIPLRWKRDVKEALDFPIEDWELLLERLRYLERSMGIRFQGENFDSGSLDLNPDYTQLHGLQEGLLSLTIHLNFYVEKVSGARKRKKLMDSVKDVSKLDSALQFLRVRKNSYVKRKEETEKKCQQLEDYSDKILQRAYAVLGHFNSLRTRTYTKDQDNPMRGDREMVANQQSVRYLENVCIENAGKESHNFEPEKEYVWNMRGWDFSKTHFRGGRRKKKEKPLNKKTQTIFELPSRGTSDLDFAVESFDFTDADFSCAQFDYGDKKTFCGCRFQNTKFEKVISNGLNFSRSTVKDVRIHFDLEHDGSQSEGVTFDASDLEGVSLVNVGLNPVRVVGDTVCKRLDIHRSKNKVEMFGVKGEDISLMSCQGEFQIEHGSSIVGLNIRFCGTDNDTLGQGPPEEYFAGLPLSIQAGTESGMGERTRLENVTIARTHIHNFLIGNRGEIVGMGVSDSIIGFVRSSGAEISNATFHDVGMLDFEASNSSQLHFIHLKDAQGLHPALPRKMDGSEVKVNLRDTYLQGIKFEDSAFMLDVQNCHSEGGISILRGKISELRLVNNNFQEFSVDSSDVQYMEMDETKGPAVGLVPNIEFDGTSFDEIELTLKDPMRFFRYTHFSGKCKKLKIVNDGMYVDIEHYVIWKADESEFILEPRDHQEFIHYAQETGKVLSFFSDENFYIAYPGDKEMRQVHFYSGEERPVSRKSSWELVQGAWRKAEGLTVIDVPDSLGVEEMQNWVAQTVLYLQNPRSVQKWQEENPGLTFSIIPRVTKIS